MRRTERELFIAELEGDAKDASNSSTRKFGNIRKSLALTFALCTALVSGEKSNFQYIIRLLNTNVDGKQKIMYALTKIKGVGRRYSNLVCKKADVDLSKRYVLIHSLRTTKCKGFSVILTSSQQCW